MTDRFLEVPGARLAFDVQEGAGPTVVALHGLSSSRANEDVTGVFGWQQVAAEGRRLLRYDARAHGRSTGRPVPEDFLWPHLAEDLSALLDAVAPGEVVDAIGVSMGVGTLLHAVGRRPERFRRLALVIPPTAWASRTAQSAAYEQVASAVEQVGPEAVLRAMAAQPRLPLLEASGWVDAPPDVEDALLSSVFRGAARTDFPTSEVVSAIEQPVLLLPWIDDPGHPVATAEQLHELLPNSVLAVNRTPEDLRTLGARVAAFLS